MPMIGARFYLELEKQQRYVDVLETDLSKEMQNGRLFRLMSKIMFVTDRPEAKGDSRWAETGDRCVHRTSALCLRYLVPGASFPGLDPDGTFAFAPRLTLILLPQIPLEAAETLRLPPRDRRGKGMV